MNIKNEAKWGPMDSTGDPKGHDYEQLKQLSVTYFIKYIPINIDSSYFCVTLCRIGEGGREQQIGKLITQNELIGYPLTKKIKQNLIKEMKIVGQKLFNDSFDYLYGNCK